MGVEAGSLRAAEYAITHFTDSAESWWVVKRISGLADGKNVTPGSRTREHFSSKLVPPCSDSSWVRRRLNGLASETNRT